MFDILNRHGIWSEDIGKNILLRKLRAKLYPNPLGLRSALEQCYVLQNGRPQCIYFKRIAENSFIA